jgi:phage terminase large subunit GpA-like protein
MIDANAIQHIDRAIQIYRDVYRVPSKESVSEYCRSNLRFNEPNNSGPFTTLGREYIIEPLDTWKDDAVKDLVLVFGSQSGKTGMIMGGVAWMIANFPSRALWVMPGKELAQSFSETRWQPMLRASPSLAGKIPTGAARHAFKKTQQMLDGGAIVGFIGSNSPSQLSSTPARMVVMDEVDKFKEGTSKEASAVNLAEQRTKSFANPKRIKTSTPTLDTGLIWQEFLKGDQRRYFVPCPHCGRRVVLAWGAEFTVFKLTGSEAFVAWDKAAKIGDNDWDYDLVRSSAHAVCPHCNGRILDGHKTGMNRQGEWRPTAQSSAGFRSYHLPSIYAASPETSFGNLAVKFLKEKNSLSGLQGFVNGDLAEPWQNQHAAGERHEIIVSAGEKPLDGCEKILTADFQLLNPHFWYKIREWTPKGDSRGIEYGHLETWGELEAKQKEHGILDNRVCVDSGHDAGQVYDECLKRGKLVHMHNMKVPMWVGWIPAKGIDRRNWKSEETDGLYVPFNLFPMQRNIGNQQVELDLLEFSSETCKDILARLRGGKTGFKWEVASTVATREYWQHMDAEVKSAVSKNFGRIQYRWKLKHQKIPNHLLDCETMQIAMAIFILRLSLVEEKQEPKQEQEKVEA